MSSTSEAPRAWSLRERMTRLLGAPLLALWLLVSAAVLGFVIRTAAEDADAALRRAGTFFEMMLEHEHAENGGDLSGLAFMGLGLFDEQSIAVWNARGELVIGEAAHTFPRPAKLPALSDEQRDGVPWRVLTMPGAGGALTVQIAEPAEHRRRHTERLALLLGGGALAVMLLLAVIVRLVARHVLRPVARAAQELAQRGPGDLHAVSAAALPSELAPLISSLNGLFGQLAVAFERERIFAATAAHELRTPLAAAKLNAQLLRGGGAEPETIADLLAAIDRAVRLLEQLSTLSRIDSGELAHDWSQKLSLRRLVEETAGQLQGLAHARDVVLVAEAPEQRVAVPNQAAYMLLRNLAENAIKSSPRDGRVEIGASVDGGRWVLEVADEGPGLPQAQRQRLTGSDDGRALGDGSGGGLGLAIVRRLARQLGADIETAIGLGGRGTRIRLSFALRDAA